MSFTSPRSPASGSAVYLEDGVEEQNVVEYNLMAHVHPVFRAANGGFGQGGETFAAMPDQLLIPADTSAAGFYALNAHNAWVGNVASGGWSGFVRIHCFPQHKRRTSIAPHLGLFLILCFLHLCVFSFIARSSPMPQRRWAPTAAT